jgi:hypothetical protein
MLDKRNISLSTQILGIPFSELKAYFIQKKIPEENPPLS